MELTIDFIKENFDIINVRYFNGELKTPKFKIIHAKTYLGECWYDDNTHESVIRISDTYDIPENGIMDIIAHECIHLYICQNQIEDTSSHGKVFKSIADRLNAEGGFNIVCTDSTGGYGLRNKKANAVYYIACFRMGTTGEYFSFSINKNNLDYYKNEFDCHPGFFQNAFIFISSDDKKYAGYPKCRKGVRGRYIDFTEFNMLRNNENVIYSCQTLMCKKSK